MGMDFPNDIKTNVYSLENVTEIHWAFYQKCQNEKEDYGTFVDAGKRHISHLIQSAAHDLLEQGKHVLWDEDKRGIWVFCLSAPERDTTHQLLGPYDYECLCSGRVHSTDLILTSGHGAQLPRPTTATNTTAHSVGRIGDLNTQNYNANINEAARSVVINLGDSTKGVLNTGWAYIYQRIIKALSQSMIYFLAKENQLLQIGTSIGVKACTTGDSVFDNLHSDATGSNTINCNVQWLPSGSLLFSFCENTMLRLSTLDDSFFEDGSSCALEIGEAILLSPSGIVGQYQGTEKTPKSHPSYHSKLAAKNWISSQLMRKGLSMPQHTQWIHVLLDADVDRNENKEIISDVVTTGLNLWPAHLCLYKAAPALLDDLDLGDQDTDPLERAQSWFLGKDARAEAIETRRRKDVAEAERVKEVKKIDDASVLTDHQHQNQNTIGQEITPRDVSGIYPTPPDGLPSAAHDPSMSNDPQSSVIDEKAMDEQINRTYEENASDELFGEMDIDMFTTHGLTEDDFSFFDDPNAASRNNAAFGNDGFALGQEAAVADSPLVETSNSGSQQGPNTSTSPLSLEPGGNTSHSAGKDSTEGAKEEMQIPEADIFANEQGNVRGVLNMEAETSQPNSNVESLFPVSGPPKEVSFDTVPFLDNSSEFDRKYSLNGRYGFELDSSPDVSKPGNQSSAPTLLQVGKAAASAIEGEMDLDETDDDPSTRSSVLSQNLHEDASQEMPQQTSRKRKRSPSDKQEHPVTPLSPAPLSEMSEYTSVTAEAALFWPRTDGQANGFLKSGQKTSNEYSMFGDDRTFVQVAQMVADQAISSQHLPLQQTKQSPTEKLRLSQLVQSILASWASTSGKVNKHCTLMDFVGHDDQDKEQGAPDSKLPKPSRASAAAPISKLQDPYTSVQRSGTLFDIAASALHFWEELGLAPVHNGKDITAFCLFPVERNVQSEVTTFLNMLKATYQSCKLGLHNLGSGPAKTANGPVAMPYKDDALLGRACEEFGSWLGQSNLQDRNVVIYMVNPFDDTASLPSLCLAFLKLFNAYCAVVKDDPSNDLVLQILPSNLIYSESAIPLPSPTEYRRLAFEVYDRCCPTDPKERSYIGAPAIRLARSIPKTIDFRLTPDNPAFSLESENCLHLAYVWTPGEDWLTASWTDNLGMLSWTACYCFTDQNPLPWLSFSEIAREIWETTLDMLQPRSGRWRIVLCKDGAVYKNESLAWQSVIKGSSKPILKAPILFSFVTIEAQPLLDFSVSNLQHAVPNPLETPENTPQASVASPDISGIASTPGGAVQANTPPSHTSFGDADAEARLVDITDESWGVVMNRSVNDVCVPSEFCPALASGFLLKRAGPRDEDGVVRMGVNIIHGQKPHRPLLRTVLTMYRHLGLLARIRGIVDPLYGVAPNHVAAARNAQEAVLHMRYINALTPG